ncbi:hypothetical protein Hanom_Chr11g01034771 [Helianthus anomalus]
MCSNECLPRTVKKLSPKSLPTVAHTRVSGRRCEASLPFPRISASVLPHSRCSLSLSFSLEASIGTAHHSVAACGGGGVAAVVRRHQNRGGRPSA